MPSRQSALRSSRSRARAQPFLPFFIEWGHETSLPGRAPATHRAGPVEIAQLKLAGDADRLGSWLGAHSLFLTVGAVLVPIWLMWSGRHFAR